MTDISEEDAILHLKRALGEISAGDAVPAPLPAIPKPKPAAPKPKAEPPKAKAPSLTSTPLTGGLNIGGLGSLGSQFPLGQQLGLSFPSGPQVGPQIGPSPVPVQKPEKKQKTSHDAFAAAAAVPVMTPPASTKKSQASSAAALPFPTPAPAPTLPFPAPAQPQVQAPPQPTAKQQATKIQDFGTSGPQAVATAAALAAEPGKSQTHFEVSQLKVGLLIGKQASTLNAIKAYTKSHCYIEQHTPDDDHARVTVVGSATQIEKCKMTVLALIDGSMSLGTLFSLAGVPMPAGAKEHAQQCVANATAASQAPPPSAPAPAAPAPQFGAVPPPAFGAVPPPMPMMPPTTQVPGMPENHQMQQNLNDYYARMWSTYGKQQQQHAKKEDEGPAFDKDMLARLAEKAAKGPIEDEPPPPPPAEEVAPMVKSGLADRASAEVRALLGGDDAQDTAPPPSAAIPAPRAAPSMQQMQQEVPPQASMAMPALAPGTQPGQVKNFTLKGFLRPGAADQKPKKDDDSVQKMMERLQGNVSQSKQVEPTPQGAAHQRMNVSQVFPGDAPASGAPFAAVGRQETRTRSDVEFEQLMSKMAAVQTQEDIEHVGREVLIRFPAFAPHQLVDLMQKVNGAEALQHDEFLAELTRLVIPRLRELTSSQFTSLTSTLAAWSADVRGDRKRRSGRFPELSKAFFSASSSEMSSRLMEFAPHEINCCLAAFVSVGFAEHKFFSSVGRAALARHASFAPVQLTAMLAILSEMRLVHVDLFNAAATFLSARARELRPVDIIRVMRSYAKCSVQHHVLCRAIGDEVVSRVREKGHNSAFKAEELSEIAWCLCILQYYHDTLFRLMFKSFERCPMISSEALIMVYECHLALECFDKDSYSRYAIDYDIVSILRDHYKEYRKDERRCSERQRNDVASVLKSLVEGSVHVNHRSSTGLLVDVAALRKRSSADGFIHVDLDSAVTVVRSLDQDEPTASTLIVEGCVAMRRNVLARHGLKIVTVRETEWRELEDSKDKRRYLRSLLSGMGDVLK